MSDQTLLLLVVGVTIVLYITQVIRIEVTSLFVIVVLPALGILDGKEALSGFSSSATLTVGSMLVLSVALERAGVVDYAARLLSRGKGSGIRGLLVVLAVPTAVISAFINNTPVVALMIPVTLTLARRAGIAPSKVLLPVSYFSILGGTCTLFGTSTNIIVNDLYRQSGGPGLGVFEFAPLGIVYCVVGISYILLFAPRLLPDRKGFSDLVAVQAPGHFVTEVTLKPGSKHAGRTLAQVFPPAREITVIEVVRGEEPYMKPAGDFVLEEGDMLFVESTARPIYHVMADPELERGTAVEDDKLVPLFELLAGEALEGADGESNDAASPGDERVGNVDLRIAEAIVTPNSTFIGRRVRALGLSRKHGVQVLALRRLGRRHQYKLLDLSLRAGDVLLVQGEPESLRLLAEEGDVILVEGVERSLTFPEKAPLALGILAAVVVLAALEVAPIVMLALAGVGLMLLTRCIDARDTVRALDPQVILLLAGTIPLGLAMEKSGLAGEIATKFVELVGDRGTWVIIAGLYVLTITLTEIVSNNACAVLLTPIALGIATQVGMDAKPLMMAIAFGASASFATPIGYQTNTLVMGPGGYKFVDYFRIGLPLNLVMAATASLLIPWFFPP